jgi:NADPH:quinone reductase-like Zn-dependent oxidoreductase
VHAAFHDGTGGPEILRYGPVPDPKPTDSDVLVRMRASSMDRLDVFRREGSHGVGAVGRHIGGRDVAGVVEAVGAEVTRFRPGDAVVGIVKGSSGAHAELVVCEEALTFPLPPACAFEPAAAAPTAGRSAWAALVERARVRVGERVLVFAAGSGVGSFAVQIARAAGCQVIATAGADWKCARALEIGADAVINHSTEDVAARALELTDGRGVDVVVDHVGAPVWDAAFASLNDGGRFVTTGVTAGHRVQLHLGKVFTNGVVITGVGRPGPAEIRRHLGALLDTIGQGRVRPIVDSTYPLAELARAHARMEDGQFFGKLVVTP